MKYDGLAGPEGAWYPGRPPFRYREKGIHHALARHEKLVGLEPLRISARDPHGPSLQHAQLALAAPRPHNRYRLLHLEAPPFYRLEFALHPIGDHDLVLYQWGLLDIPYYVAFGKGCPFLGGWDELPLLALVYRGDVYPLLDEIPAPPFYLFQRALEPVKDVAQYPWRELDRKKLPRVSHFLVGLEPCRILIDLYHRLAPPELYYLPDQPAGADLHDLVHLAPGHTVRHHEGARNPSYYTHKYAPYPFTTPMSIPIALFMSLFSVSSFLSSSP